ncbi:MAG: SBBP repeat-containing protein [Bacteroidetes bacterium]|nr:SBBP repeat-containing protein [Bacteroidota bacterium]
MKILLLTVYILTSIILKAQPGFVWTKGIGGSDSYMYSKSITTDNSGNVYVTGYFSDTVDFDPGVGVCNLIADAYDIFILKLNASGNLIWAKQFNGPYSEGGNAVVVDAKNNIYVTGYFQGTVDFDPGNAVYNLNSSWANSADIFVCKLNASGNFVWAKKMGGTNNEYAYSIAVDSLGNVYITGQYEDIADFDPGSGVYNLTPVDWVDCFISKLDSSGNFVWAKSIGGNAWDYSFTLCLDRHSNVYTTGYFSDTVDFDPGQNVYNLISMDGKDDVFVNKLDKNGNFIWAKSFSGPSNYDRGFSMAIDLSGNIITTGMFEDSVDFDPGLGIHKLYASGNYNFACKLDSSGSFIWAKQIGGSNSHVTTDNYGNVYTTGTFYFDSTDFDPGPGVYYMTPSPITTESSAVGQLDDMGNFICAGQTTGYSSQSLTSIAVHNNDVYILGDFNGTADFDPGAGVFNLSSISGYNDIFITKLNACSQITDDHEIIKDAIITLYPNPSVGLCTVNFSNEFTGQGELIVTDIYGKILDRIKINSGSNKVDMNYTNYANGVYMLSLINAKGETVNRKMIITR